MDEKDLVFESVNPEKVPEGVIEEDGALYDSDGNPIPADNVLVAKIEKPKPKFVNMFTKDAKIPSGSVTLDENGMEINSKLNIDKSPLSADKRDALSEIMGDDFVKAFASGKAINNNKDIKITKLNIGNASN